MPGFDRTGPMGAGPVTGGGFGYCAGGAGRGVRGGQAQWYGPGYGRAFGRGGRFRGRGRDFGPFGWWASGSPGVQEERAALESRMADLKAEMASIDGRLADMSQPADE